jgi:hypothetical protein
MTTILGIKKEHLNRVPKELLKTWKPACNSYEIQTAYEKISPSEWFSISEEIEKLEIGFLESPEREKLEEWINFISKRLATESDLPKILLSLGISYTLLSLEGDFLSKKVKKEKFGSKSRLYPEKKKLEKKETKNPYVPKKTKSQKIKVKPFLGFFEGFTNK